ncbi:GMC oxidoreductase [Trichoderma gracile]
MTTTDQLPTGAAGQFDYIIVGGGTAGCVIASRLSGYLPHKNILMIEGGPSDVGDDRALILKDRFKMQGTELDYAYTSVEQPKGNSNILHSRAKILGGCSSHNDMVSFRTPEYDAYTWERLGCSGWSFETFKRLYQQLRVITYPGAHPRDQNQLSKDWILSAHRALGLPLVKDFNKGITSSSGLTEGAGWTPLSYNPETGWRGSASVSYIHPILRGDEKRSNLTILTNAWVSRVNLQGDTATSVNVTTSDGQRHVVRAATEIILCAGAIDTPRLMLLSGLGPRERLESVNIPVVKEIPGVGENLQDHPCTLVQFELHDEVPENTATHSDVLAFLRHKPYNWAGDDGNIPDILLHMWQLNDDMTPAGYERPKHPFIILPVVLRTHARGSVYLKSKDPQDKPDIDFKYFEDADGYDADLLVAGIKAVRKMAASEPLRSWIKHEVAPGAQVTSDEELNKYARAASQTMFHPACTTKMGDVLNDPKAVVDSRLCVRGIKNLRIADAGIFPTMITVNLMLTVLAVGERAAELIAEDAGWQGSKSRL